MLHPSEFSLMSSTISLPKCPPPTCVTVQTHSRLHLGFFDLSQQAQRRFGSLGVAVNAFETRVSVQRASQSTPLAAWQQAIVARQQQALGVDEPLDVHVAHSIPRHSGLGSGTQMALAIGCAIDRLYHPHSIHRPAQIAHMHQRGMRSGIGVACFAQGGIVLDGGKGQATHPPPVLARYAFPETWRFLLVLDTHSVGLHGASERVAFQQLPPQSQAATHAIASELLTQALPALLEADFAAFSASLGHLQTYNADYFAAAQGGAFTSARVEQAVAYLKAAGYRGCGQSSWGPTGFVLLPDQSAAEQACAQLQRQFADEGLSFLICQAVNQGAQFQLD